MARTQSEKWFEDYCFNAGLVCKRIPEEDSKTPDYQLEIDGKTIIVEVKEITRNKEEQMSDSLLEVRGYGEVISSTPGDRVRKKIENASAQIKARAEGVHPSILVLCDIRYGCAQIVGHTSRDNIRAGMYGLEQILIAVPQDNSARPYWMGMKYGPKRKMTTEHNTSISAIGVLSTPEKEDIRLDIYHNVHAAQPLDPDLISRFGVRQFCLVEQRPGTTAQWEEIRV